MKQTIYKARVFEHTDDMDRTWFEVVYFTNYGKKNQDIVCKVFNTFLEAENHLRKKLIA